MHIRNGVLEGLLIMPIFLANISVVAAQIHKMLFLYISVNKEVLEFFCSLWLLTLLHVLPGFLLQIEDHGSNCALL